MPYIKPPVPLPVWFVPLTQYKYGLRKTRPEAPRITRPKYQWVLDQWTQFDLWRVWYDRGRKGKRPLVWDVVPRWAWNLREELWRKAKQQDPQDPTPNIPRKNVPAIFKQLAVWVNTGVNCPPASWPFDNYKVGIYQGLDGLDEVPGLDRWARELRAEGKAVFGWSWIGDPDPDNNNFKLLRPKDPAAHGRRAAELCRHYGLDGWWLNGEKNCEGGSADHRGLRTSGQIVAAFREMLPNTPLGWTTEPGLLDLDHWYFQQEGVCIGPQPYPYENGWWVENVLWAARSKGYRVPDDVAVLCQAYETNGKRPPANEFVRQLNAGGCKWGILYPGDQALSVPEWWAEFATVAR